MEENYYALYLAIFRNINAQDAINYIKYGKTTQHFKENINIDRVPYLREKYEGFEDPNEIERIIKLKENHTWIEIGDIEDIDWTYIYRKVYRYKNKKAITNDLCKETSICLTNKTITL